MIRAVVFDVDGTLVDSVDSHATSWQDSFRHFGHEFDYEDIRSQIGKGGDQLMPMFLSEEEIEAKGEQIEAYRSALVKEQFFPKITGFPRVRELMESLISRNIDIVLASSAKKDELKFYKKVADIADVVHKETTSDDADASKPEPDIFEAAIELLPGVAKNEIIVVGDTPYDAEAAGEAGLRTVGVLCGGFAEADLRKAGCVAIFLDPADLLKKLDQWVSGITA
jgi:HAD superfamily hydrolase (TIGR01549 family)